MLVLSRKVGERVLIGQEVSVTIVRIGPNAVRLGIQAPRGLKIVRDELLGEEIDGYHEIDVPLEGVIVPALFSDCGNCRQAALDGSCVGADA